MEPTVVKQNIRNTQDRFNELRQELLSNIKHYVEFLATISHGAKGRIIAANRLPYTLTLSQLHALMVSLDTSDGVKIILEDRETQVPIDNLPLEDLLQLYKKLYYQ